MEQVAVPLELNREQRRAAEGFQPKRKRKRLNFEGGDLEGLVVILKPTAFGDLLDMIDMVDMAGLQAQNIRPEDVKKLRDLLQQMMDGIESWNLLDDDGQPVPDTLEALLREEDTLVLAIVNAWTGALASVPAPLGQRSPVGWPSPVATLPMEDVSPSQPS